MGQGVQPAGLGDRDRAAGGEEGEEGEADVHAEARARQGGFVGDRGAVPQDEEDAGCKGEGKDGCEECSGFEYEVVW